MTYTIEQLNEHRARLIKVRKYQRDIDGTGAGLWFAMIEHGLIPSVELTTWYLGQPTVQSDIEKLFANSIAWTDAEIRKASK
jgi:hypothetical protein